MEINQPTAPQTQPMPTPHEEHIGFPAPRGDNDKKGGLVKWIVAGIGVISIVVIGAIFVLRPPADESSDSSNNNDQGSVLQAVATPVPTEDPEPTPTVTPEPVEKSEIAIQILNGTGTPGDASKASDALSEAGFENVEAANSDEQNETETTLTYSSDIPQQVVDEIEAALGEIFDGVRVRRGTVSDDFDIRITTGPKKGTTSADSESNTTEDDTSE